MHGKLVHAIHAGNHLCAEQFHHPGREAGVHRLVEEDAENTLVLPYIVKESPGRPDEAFLTL